MAERGPLFADLSAEEKLDLVIQSEDEDGRESDPAYSTGWSS